jgi:hypothetical protein
MTLDNKASEHQEILWAIQWCKSKGYSADQYADYHLYGNAVQLSCDHFPVIASTWDDAFGTHYAPNGSE